MRRHRLAAAVLGAAVLLLAAGCAAPAAPDPAPSAPADVEQAFTELADELGTVGAFMLVRTPSDEYALSYGTVAEGSGTIPAADTVFRIGSNTKTFTATAILLLVEDGLLDLDTPLAEYRPDVPEAERITIRMLLAMRSGIGNYTANEAWVRASLADPARVWEPDELVRLGLEMPRPFEPDAAYEYSNTNTVLLGQIAEQVAGVPLEELFEERLFGPMGMRATALPAAADVDLPDPFAHGYTVLEGTGRTDTTGFNPSWAWAAGGAFSSAHDLLDWAASLSGTTLLDPDLAERRLASIAPISDDPALEDWGYGWGLARLHGLIGHSGQLPGYNSVAGHDPDSGVSVVIWANVAPSDDGRDPANTIADALVPLVIADAQATRHS